MEITAREKRQFTIIWGIIILILIILFIALLSASIKTIGFLEFAILFDQATKNVYDDDNYLKLNGRHAIGVGNKFIKLPARRITLMLSNNDASREYVDFSEKELFARTKDGVSVSIQISAQLKLIDVDELDNDDNSDEEIKAINTKFLKTIRQFNLYDSENYLAILLAILKSKTLDAMSTFRGNEIYRERKKISDKIFEEYQTKLNEFNIKLIILNVHNMQYIDSSIEGAIEQTQVFKQKMQETLLLKDIVEIKLDYLKETTKVENENRINRENAQGEAATKIGEGRGIGLKYLYERLANKIDVIENKVGIIDDDTMNYLLYLSVFKNSLYENQVTYLLKSAFIDSI